MYPFINSSMVERYFAPSKRTDSAPNNIPASKAKKEIIK